MSRRLGQHFLTDPTILDRIVDALDPQPDDLVLEIGPGTGTLTRRLAPRVGWVVAVEKDVELVARETGHGMRDTGLAAEDRRLPANVTVIHGDALRLDWDQALKDISYPVSRIPSPGHKLIGNIPYYITSPLIDKALTPPFPTVIVFLVQKEVAERLVAEPGGKTYGALTVGVQALADVEKLFTVRRGSFQPPPAVDSAVVRMRPKTHPLIDEGERAPFRVFVQELFSYRRKQISTILRATTDLNRDGLRSLLAKLDIDPKSRPEVLGPDRLVALFRDTREWSKQRR
ncbi:MAG: 16S rRNA (adenine(1518)-N(6)/adenine(1519)-N(6))-dimethyltransferase RsmA [Gemmatimonadota bacterium]|nr:16S rRNA (adenine(1518)-N(6)/adenine(1519)-N(6))-dimethyltransferase RsmA [Gemmatimonadota bacterium]